VENPSFILVNVREEKLTFFRDQRIVCEYPVSTAKLGVGEEMGSNKTPRGWHYVRCKIGENCPQNTVFVRRRPTGEIYSPELALAFPNRSWILTRILWLCGLEKGKNRFGSCDSMRRYIYIHGAPDTYPIGKPHSKGCINMHNKDIIALFDAVPLGTPVLIQAD